MAISYTPEIYSFLCTFIFYNQKSWWKKVYIHFICQLKSFFLYIKEICCKHIWEQDKIFLGINEKTAMMKTQAYECVCVDVTVRAKKRAETALNAHWRLHTVKLQSIAIEFCLRMRMNGRLQYKFPSLGVWLTGNLTNHNADFVHHFIRQTNQTELLD